MRCLPTCVLLSLNTSLTSSHHHHHRQTTAIPWYTHCICVRVCMYVCFVLTCVRQVRICVLALSWYFFVCVFFFVPFNLTSSRDPRRPLRTLDLLLLLSSGRTGCVCECVCLCVCVLVFCLIVAGGEGLKGEFTAKSKKRIFPLSCGRFIHLLEIVLVWVAEFWRCDCRHSDIIELHKLNSSVFLRRLRPGDRR